MRKTYALDDDGFVWTLHGAPGSTPKKLSLDFRVRSLAVSDDDDTLILEKQQRSAGNNDTAEENAAAAFFLCNNKSGDVKRLV